MKPVRQLSLVVIALMIVGVLGGMSRAEEASASGLAGDRAGFALGGAALWESDSDLARDLDGVRETGATWLRVDFDWPSIEPTAGARNWGPTDRVVQAAQARGLSVIALPTYTPAWARPAGTGSRTPPSEPVDFATFVGNAAQRYALSGVKVWEIWNEPNRSTYWEPHPDAGAYTTLLRAAAASLRAVDPSATILSAGLAPAVDAADGSQISPITFLQGIYAANGGPSFDAVGIHPSSYPALPMDPATASWNTFYRLPLLYDVMVANGDGAKKIWATELSAPTAGPTSVSEARQAQILTEAYAAFARWSWSGPMLWFSFRDAGSDPGNVEDHMGLVRADFTPKPALAALTASLAGPPPPPLAAGGVVDADTSTLEGSAGHWAPWYSSTVARSTAQAHSGNASLQIGVGSNHWGVALDNYPYFPATPGPTTIGFWARTSSPGAQRVSMSVTWRNADGAVLGAVLGTDTVTISALTTTWQQAIAAVTAPAGTSRAGITLSDSTGIPGSTLYLDDITVGYASPPPPPPDAGVLDTNTATLEGAIGHWIPWYSATVTRSTVQAHTGNASLKIGVGSTHWAVTLDNYPYFPAAPGHKTIGFWARTPSAGARRATMTVTWRDASGAVLAIDTVASPALTSTWQQATATVIAPAGTVTSGVDLSDSNGTPGTTLFIDDVYVSTG